MRDAVTRLGDGRPRTAGRHRLFVVLACAAILGHLTQVAHFLSVPHEVGRDGHLHHAGAEVGGDRATDLAASAPGTFDPGTPGPDDPADPDAGDRCPLHPPGHEPCAGIEPPPPPPSPAPQPANAPARDPAPATEDVLAFAPKHSPPVRSRS